jgi:protein-S-isoprenylcysteine O-methyltransferase Ste14
VYGGRTIHLNVFLGFRAGLYATGFVLAWAWIAVAVWPLDDLLGGALPTWVRPVGVPLTLAGGALALSCIAVFASRGHGTPAPFDPPREFVACGPYRWVRNPMYLGGASLLAGIGLWIRSPAITLLAFVGVVLAHIFVVLYEEPTLNREFGAAYAEYRYRVRRWLPHRPRRDSGVSTDGRNVP